MGGAGKTLLLMVVAATFAACGGGDATSPTPAPVGYEGRWTGSAQTGGVPLGIPLPGTFAFTVSRDQRVTAIEFDYRLNGCSGRISAANLNLPFFDYPSFGQSFEYRSTDFTQPNYVAVFGSFRTDGSATGVISLGQYAGCGDGGGVWTARR